MADIFERLKTAGAGMGTRDPNDYSFMVSVADAVLIGRRIADLEAALREAVEELTACERMLSGETYNSPKFNRLLGIDAETQNVK